MAHEIEQYDNMVSAHQKPWHGLGVVLDHNPTPKEAQKAAELTWKVRKEPVYYRMPAIDGMSRIMEVPESFAVVRNDNQQPLGLVGKDYLPYQNDELFDFMETFCQTTQSKMETAGSLRNGRIVWALSTSGETEYMKGDTIKQYFLFKNSFDGSTNIEICFTDIRVVCNNTLTAALRSAKNIWRIRHTSNLHEQVELAKEAILGRKKYEETLDVIMRKMASMPIKNNEAEMLVNQIVRNQIHDMEEIAADQKLEDIDQLTAHQKRTMNKILELNEYGAGTNIPGVRGSLYGLLHACTEYADHFKTIRPGNRTWEEAHFESIMMGSSQDFKQKAFDRLMEFAK